MKFVNGIRVTPLHHEFENEFERQLERFKEKATEFYTRPRPGNESNEEQAKREKIRKEDFAHLERESRYLSMMGALYARVEAQKEAAKAKPGESRRETRARINRLKAEKHHPTKHLARAMRAAGRAQPSKRHTPHHVIPGKGWTKWANQARVRIHLHGIAINDDDNGAWMLKAAKFKPLHWFAEQANAHKEIHTENYEQWVQMKVYSASDEKSCRAKLKEIWNMLETGTQPKQIRFAPEDWPEGWDGE